MKTWMWIAIVLGLTCVVELGAIVWLLGAGAAKEKDAAYWEAKCLESKMTGDACRTGSVQGAE